MYLFKCIIEFAHMQRGKDFSNPGLSGKPQAEPKSAVSHNPAEKLPLSENNWILFNEIKLIKQNKFNDLYPYQSQANKQKTCNVIYNAAQVPLDKNRKYLEQ